MIHVCIVTCARYVSFVMKSYNKYNGDFPNTSFANPKTSMASQWFLDDCSCPGRAFASPGFSFHILVFTKELRPVTSPLLVECDF